MKIIAKKRINVNGNIYLKGEELKDLTYEQIVKLNEMGFIEPLNIEDLALLKKPKEKIIKED